MKRYVVTESTGGSKGKPITQQRQPPNVPAGEQEHDPVQLKRKKGHFLDCFSQEIKIWIFFPS